MIAMIIMAFIFGFLLAGDLRKAKDNRREAEAYSNHAFNKALWERHAREAEARVAKPVEPSGE